MADAPGGADREQGTSLGRIAARDYQLRMHPPRRTGVVHDDLAPDTVARAFIRFRTTADQAGRGARLRQIVPRAFARSPLRSAIDLRLPEPFVPRRLRRPGDVGARRRIAERRRLRGPDAAPLARRRGRRGHLVPLASRNLEISRRARAFRTRTRRYDSQLHGVDGSVGRPFSGEACRAHRLHQLARAASATRIALSRTASDLDARFERPRLRFRGGEQHARGLGRRRGNDRTHRRPRGRNPRRPIAARAFRAIRCRHRTAHRPLGTRAALDLARTTRQRSLDRVYAGYDGGAPGDRGDSKRFARRHLGRYGHPASDGDRRSIAAASGIHLSGDGRVPNASAPPRCVASTRGRGPDGLSDARGPGPRGQRRFLARGRNSTRCAATPTPQPPPWTVSRRRRYNRRRRA